MENKKMSMPFSLGFMGGSINSAIGYVHSISCKMDNRWTVDAGCFSTSTKRNSQTAHAYGVSTERIYQNLYDMIKEEKKRLDAIVILTPTPSHYENIMTCLREDIPVICEKSLVTNSCEAEAILEFCKDKNRFLVVTYNYSGYPMVRELNSIIHQGILGEILHFQAEMPQEGFIRVDASGNKPEPQAWRLTDGHVPIIYLDLASHLHHMIYYLIRERPIEVIASQNSYGWFSNVIDNVSCLCRYSGGVQGQIWFSKSALGYRNGLRLRIYGSKASAEWCQGFPEELMLCHVDGRRVILDRASTVAIANLRRYNRFKAGHPAGFIEAFANIYYDIADCLQQYKITGAWDSEDVFSADLALESLYLFDAMIDSLDKKTWQSIHNKIR